MPTGWAMVVERKRYGIKSSMMQLSYLSEARGNLGMQNGNTKSASCYTRLQKTVADETADAFPISTEIPRVHCFQRRSPVCLDLGWIWSPGDCIRSLDREHKEILAACSTTTSLGADRISRS